MDNFEMKLYTRETLFTNNPQLFIIEKLMKKVGKWSNKIILVSFYHFSGRYFQALSRNP
jgi:hypothetical protein